MSQKNLVEDLKRQIADGQVVVVIGTGVSIATCRNQEVEGFPIAGWTGLLRHGVHWCQTTESVLTDKEAKVVQMQIELGDTDFLISAAELITTRLRGKRPGAFRGWLKDTIGKLEAVQPEIIQTLADWPARLATLNYDGLIEAVTGRQPITWQDRDKVEDYLRYGGSAAVLHLHGYFDEPESVILGLSSYARVANDPHTQAVLQLFTLDRTLLFVGCGGTFQDPNFSRLIEWGQEALQDSTHRHFVLCRESEKETFVELGKTAPWLYPVEFGAEHEDLLPFLRQLTPSAVAGRPPGSSPKLQSTLNLAGYAKAVRERYARLKLESMEMTGSYYREVELWRVFIPQNVRECQEYLPQVLELPKEHLRRLRERGQWEGQELDPGELDELRRRYLEQSPRNALELVDDSGLPKIVILGDPGSGKSSLLQALALRWTERSEAEWQTLDLPLLVELRAYALARERGHTADFLDFIKEGQSIPFRLEGDELKRWLEAGRVRMFFDGLDEVFDPALREEVVNAIQRFANDFPRVWIIVTSRVIGYRGQSFRSAGFRHFMLQELDDEQIAAFLDKWHRDTYRPNEAAERDEKRNRLARSIADSQPIRELAGNPLLLTMMAILNRYRELPRDRAALYEDCSKLLLQQWKVEEALRADPDLTQDAMAISLREKQDMLRRLAREMQTGTNKLGNLIATHRLEAVIEEAARRLVKGNPRAIARALIRQLRERNFILCFAGGDSYAFVHRTFLEYFCADDLRVRFEHEKSIDEEYLKAQIFSPHWQDETWHEVLCLVAGMIHPGALASILEFLLSQRDFEQTCRHIFLAARCVGELRKGSDLGSIADTVKRRLAELVRFDLDYFYEPWGFEAQQVTRIRTRAVTLRASVWHADPETRAWLKARAQSDEDSNVRWVAVEALARDWKEDPETVAIVKAHARSDKDSAVRQAAVEALARGWKEDPETVAIVKARARSDKDSAVRQVAVEALARGWKEDPETVAIVRARAQSDRSMAVRQAAVEALARNWKEDPETVIWLKAHAQSDKNEWVRRAAVEALARDWKEDPETVAIVKARAQSDEHPVVRQAAVEALARGWKEDPETVAIVKARARSDKDSAVRQAAVEALARGWKEDPETVAIVKAHTQSDKNEWVRQAAMQELVRGWKEDPETVAIVRARAQSDEHPVVQRAAVEALARSWKEDPETVAIVKARAQSDEDWSVRWAAVEALAKGWKEDPETAAIVRARAQSDKNSDVRQAAVKALARGWKEDTETVVWLKACAQSDKNSDVRQAAVKELVRGWKEDTETVVWLKARAQSDEDWFVQRAAVKALARGWKEDPDIMAWLKRLKV